MFIVQKRMTCSLDIVQKEWPAVYVLLKNNANLCIVLNKMTRSLYIVQKQV